MLSTQADKYHLSLAGEFFVAAELQRRGISAAVTYGNAKRADVIALSSNAFAVVIEVKSTSGNRWVVGGTVPPPAPAPWVFVHVPREPTQPPSFYVLSQAQLHSIAHVDDVTYRKRFLEKHNEEYGDRRGIVNLSLGQAAPYKNAWSTILALISPP